MMRATMSVAPPGANGTINLTGFVGQSVARSAACTAQLIAAHTANITTPVAATVAPLYPAVYPVTTVVGVESYTTT